MVVVRISYVLCRTNSPCYYEQQYEVQCLIVVLVVVKGAEGVIGKSGQQASWLHPFREAAGDPSPNFGMVLMMCAGLRQAHVWMVGPARR